MSRPKKDPYVVSDSTCKGCIHYAPLAECSISSMWCCNYLLDTGHCRPKGETCAECSVKEIREGPRQPRRVHIHIEKSSSSYGGSDRSDRRDDYSNEIVNTSTQSIKSIMEGKI